MKLKTSPSGRRMRSAAFAFCALTIASSSLWSQDPQAPVQQQGDAQPSGRPNMEQMQERQVERLTRHLNLTPDQATQVRAIYKYSAAQMMALHQDTSLSQDDKRMKLKEIRETSRGKIRDLLTEEQRPKFDEMATRGHEHENHQGQPGAPLQPPPPPQ